MGDLGTWGGWQYKQGSSVLTTCFTNAFARCRIALFARGGLLVQGSLQLHCIVLRGGRETGGLWFAMAGREQAEVDSFKLGFRGFSIEHGRSSLIARVYFCLQGGTVFCSRLWFAWVAVLRVVVDGARASRVILLAVCMLTSPKRTAPRNGSHTRATERPRPVASHSLSMAQ
jgi:hypothetical protein